MKKIKFIYLDVGGVAILDFSKTDKWSVLRANLGVNDSNRAKFESLWQKYQQRFCTDYQIENLVPLLRSQVGLKLDEDFSLVKAFVSLFEVNPTLKELIGVAKQQNISLGLLTNMYHGMLPRIFDYNLLDPLPFSVVIDSSIVGFQKPDLEIYQLAQASVETEPDEILFVDNTAENLVLPEKLGWQTLLYDPQNAVSSTQKILEKISIQNLND